jgi:hypothetical protein
LVWNVEISSIIIEVSFKIHLEFFTITSFQIIFWIKFLVIFFYHCIINE